MTEFTLAELQGSSKDAADLILGLDEDEDKEFTLEELQPKKKPRDTNLLKQGLAGLSDATYSGIPGFLGFLGGGLEAAIATATRPGDQSFLDNFTKATSGRGGGITSALMNIARKNREETSRLAGGEPKTPAEKATRLLTSFVIPGSLGKTALGKTATFLTPLVRLGPRGNRLNKDFAKRAVLQGSIGIGIDQGIRAAGKGPLLFTDETDLPDLGETSAKTEEDWLQKLKDDAAARGGELVSDDELLGGSGDDEFTLEELQGQGQREFTLEELQGPSQKEFTQDELLNPLDVDLAAQDKAVQDQADADLLKNLALIGSAAASIFGLSRWRQKVNLSRQEPVATGTVRDRIQSSVRDAVDVIKAQPKSGRFGLGGKTKAAWTIAKDKAEEFGGHAFDKRILFARALRTVGVSESKVQKLMGQAQFDTHGQLVDWLLHGELASGIKVSKPMRVLKRQYDLFDSARKQQFINYTSALMANASRTRATAADFLDKIDYKKMTKEERAIYKEIDDSFNQKIATVDADGNAIPGKEYRGTLGELESILERHAETVTKWRGTATRERPTLWKKNQETGVNEGFVDDAKIKKDIEFGENDAEFAQLRRDLGEINLALLDDSVGRGVKSKAWADSVKAQFQRGEDLLYLPGKSARQAEGWWRKKARSFGYMTTEGKNATRVGNFYQQSLKEGEGIASFLDPFQSATHYAGEVMEYNNRMVVQWNILSQLTGLSFDEAGKLVMGLPRINANAIGGRKPPALIAVADPVDPTNQYGKLNLEFPIDKNSPKVAQDLHKQLQGNTRRSLNPNDPGVNQSTPEAIERLQDTIVVEKNGKFYIFGDMDKGMKNALSFDPALYSRTVKAMAATKKVMTQFTTGRYSLFAPFSGLYNIQVAAINTAFRSQGKGMKGVLQGSKEGLQVWKDSMTGAYDLFTTQASDEFAQLLTHALETNSGIAKMAPGWTKNMQAHLAKRAKSNMMAPIQRHIGRSRTGYNASEINGEMSDALDQAAFHINEGFGSNALPQFVRIWDNLNNSLHEATAYGVTLRKLGSDSRKASGDQIRAARKFTSDVVGDTRLRGASAETFNAVVPFSGAMLQAWSTMGRAMHAGRWKTIGVLGTVVGLPTALEVTYNTTLDVGKTFKDAEGREWTYGDYYWKGFTADQRNNNRIIFVPGRDPWDAILIPFVPEFSLFRGVVIDSMEAVFGLGGNTSVQGLGANHLWAGLARTFNIPLPIPVKMLFTQAGVDVRAGPVVAEDGTSVSLFESRQLENTARTTGNNAKSRFEGGEISVRVQQMLSDIFGAAGTLGGRVYEAMHGGNSNTPLGDKLEAGLDTLGRGLAQQARYVQPLLGKQLRNRPDPNVASSVFNKKNALNAFTKEKGISTSGAGLSGGIPALGRSSDVTQDPIMQQLIINVDGYKQQIAPHLKIISDLKNQINSIGNSLYLNIPIGDIPEGPISVKQRDEIMDAMNLTIDAQNYVIKAILENEEEKFAEGMGEALGRDLSGFTFDGYVKRPNPSSASPTLPKLPQTSQ